MGCPRIHIEYHRMPQRRLCKWLKLRESYLTYQYWVHSSNKDFTLTLPLSSKKFSTIACVMHGKIWSELRERLWNVKKLFEVPSGQPNLSHNQGIPTSKHSYIDTCRRTLKHVHASNWKAIHKHTDRALKKTLRTKGKHNQFVLTGITSFLVLTKKCSFRKKWWSHMMTEKP